MHDQFSQKHVLITGGAGFIGSHLTRDLCASGALITVLDRNPYSRAALGESNVRPIQGSVQDILSNDTVSTADFDFIFHLAGNSSVSDSLMNPFDDLAANVSDTLLLLEDMRATGTRAKLVFMSSIAVYGNPKKMPITELDATYPISPYGASKLAAEKYLQVYGGLYGLATTILRVGSVYGPGQRKLVIYDLMQKLKLDPSQLVVEGDGTQERDFIHVKDVVAALRLGVLQASPYMGNIYNVASGTSVTIRDLLDRICSLTGLNPRISFINQNVKGKPARWEISIDKFRQVGFMTGIELNQGLQEVWEWLA